MPTIIEEEEMQSDAGEKDKDTQQQAKQNQPQPTGRDSTIKYGFLCPRAKQVRR